MKKLVSLLVILLLGTTLTPVFAVDTADFEKNEEHYRNLCTSTLQTEDRQVCIAFQEYINDKIKNTNQSINDLNKSISAVKDDLAKADELLRQQQAEIETAQKEMDYLTETITLIQANIKQLQKDIEVRSKEIAKVDKQIRQQLVAQQQRLHVNSIINFLFGGANYTDVLRRSNAVSQISKKDKERMDWFISERKQLEEDKTELSRQEEVLKVSLENQRQIKETLEIAKAENEKTIAQYKQQVEELNNKQAALVSQVTVSEDAIANIQVQFSNLDRREEELRLEAERLRRLAEEEKRKAEEARLAADEAARQKAEQEAARLNQESQTKEQEADQVANGNSGTFVTGSGWTLPVSGATVTAGAWYYPGFFSGIFGGGVHYGVDLGTPMGTPVYSTGPGVVVHTQTGCPAWGYLGNPCGGYGGNQVFTIISMNNKLYALNYMHLSSVNVSPGTQIATGTQLATVGSSGNSSGPHLHHEVIYLGDMSLGEYLNSWNRSLSFTPTGEWMNLNWSCDNRGGVAPCRINPQTWYGVTVGATY